MPCTAAAPHPSLCSSAGLQLAELAAAGTAAEKALLADVTAKSPDASYVELLRLFKARRRRRALVARMVHLVHVASVPAARCPRTSAPNCASIVHLGIV
jgi:hypothetical protein